MPRSMPIGKRVRLLREEHGLSQEELAERAGLSRQSIVDLERNDSYSPRLSTLEKIADALNIDIGRVIGVDPVPPNPLLEEILTVAAAMPPERQRLLVDVARAVLFPAAMNRAGRRGAMASAGAA
jgi:transcriptional regulator with XRE-family HTH domain